MEKGAPKRSLSDILVLVKTAISVAHIKLILIGEGTVLVVDKEVEGLISCHSLKITLTLPFIINDFTELNVILGEGMVKA